MGKKQRDCIGCGAPVGFLDRVYCCRCERRRREDAAKAPCPGCGLRRVLQTGSGRCILCAKLCTDCGGPLRFKHSTLCRHCRRAQDLEQRRATRRTCRRCGLPGYLREDTGWCGPCSHPGPAKQPPRFCRDCGQLRRHAGLGLCGACWQRHPDRPFVAGENLINRLEDPPGWLREFVAYLAARHCVGRCCTMISRLGRLLADEHPNHPQAVLERARRPGRSMGSLARGLEEFFTERRLALPTDQAQRLAAGRRQRRIDTAPEQLRPAVAGFCESLLSSRERARRAGTLPRADGTIESALAAVRDFAIFLITQRTKDDWALVDVADVEAFLAARPKMRARHLTVLRQFFAFARARRLVLVDPTREVPSQRDRAFGGSTVLLDEQRALFRRWTSDPEVHPHEALLGIFALLHGAASRELRSLRVADIDPTTRSVRLGQRPHPVPLDPASWTVLQRCLNHREQLRTDNPHVIVTRGHQGAANTGVDRVPLPPARPRWGRSAPAAGDPAGRSGQHHGPETRRRRVRDESRRSVDLSRRSRRRRSTAANTCNFRRHLTQVRGNMCALPKGLLLVTVSDALS
jgi:site-specific recombinase XerD